MRVSYNKLWKMLIDRGMKKSQLREAVGASKSTFAKLGKNENVTLPVFQIAHVCRAEKDKKSDIQVSKELYINQCEIGYELPDNTKYEERGV